jgi:hypothetical protein
MDSGERPTVAEEDATTQRFIDVAPRIGLGVQEIYACTFFPPSTDPRVDVTGRDAGPVIVCGATGDPATPLRGAREMAETLEDARLIIVDANHHGCYGTDPCADELIEDYLIDLTVPPETTECGASASGAGSNSRRS